MTLTSTDDVARATTDRASGGATLEVEYAAQHATVRISADPDEVDAGARLLCAAVTHLRSRHTRQVRTAVDLHGPRAGVLLDALRSRVGTDIAEIAMRRAGSTAMVTLELLPAPRRPAGTRDRRQPGERPSHARANDAPTRPRDPQRAASSIARA